MPRDDNDRGVWTLLTQLKTQGFGITFLVNSNKRNFTFEQLFASPIAVRWNDLSSFLGLS